MNRRKVAAASLAVAVVAGIGVYVFTRNTSPDEARQPGVLTAADGVVNTEQSAAAMQTQPMPQLSGARFELPPTIATGTYTDPKYRKPVEAKDKSSAR